MKCQNCERDIRRPTPGSYPDGVKWVHILSPIGAGNRYCDHAGSLATPGRSDILNP